MYSVVSHRCGFPFLCFHHIYKVLVMHSCLCGCVLSLLQGVRLGAQPPGPRRLPLHSLCSCQAVCPCGCPASIHHRVCHPPAEPGGVGRPLSLLRVQGQERRRGETAWARHLNSQTSWTVRPASPQEGSAGGLGGGAQDDIPLLTWTPPSPPACASEQNPPCPCGQASAQGPDSPSRGGGQGQKLLVVFKNHFPES